MAPLPSLLLLFMGACLLGLAAGRIKACLFVALRAALVVGVLFISSGAIIDHPSVSQDIFNAYVKAAVKSAVGLAKAVDKLQLVVEDTAAVVPKAVGFRSLSELGASLLQECVTSIGAKYLGPYSQWAAHKVFQLQPCTGILRHWINSMGDYPYQGVAIGVSFLIPVLCDLLKASYLKTAKTWTPISLHSKLSLQSPVPRLKSRIADFFSSLRSHTYQLSAQFPSNDVTVFALRDIFHQYASHRRRTVKPADDGISAPGTKYYIANCEGGQHCRIDDGLDNHQPSIFSQVVGLSKQPDVERRVNGYPLVCGGVVVTSATKLVSEPKEVVEERDQERDRKKSMWEKVLDAARLNKKSE